jgi:hypothetical protein
MNERLLSARHGTSEIEVVKERGDYYCHNTTDDDSDTFHIILQLDRRLSLLSPEETK